VFVVACGSCLRAGRGNGSAFGHSIMGSSHHDRDAEHNSFPILVNPIAV